MVIHIRYNLSIPRVLQEMCVPVFTAVLSPCLISASTSTWYLLKEKQHVEVNFDHLYYMWDLKPSYKRVLML